MRGGSVAARNTLRTFLREKLHPYHMERNHPDDDGASGLSPLSSLRSHFGSPGGGRTVEQEDWTPERLSIKATGKRAGWWGMSEGAEAFLDQLITWRELGFNMCSMRRRL